METISLLVDLQTTNRKKKFKHCSSRAYETFETVPVSIKCIKYYVRVRGYFLLILIYSHLHNFVSLQNNFSSNWLIWLIFWRLTTCEEEPMGRCHCICGTHTRTRSKHMDTKLTNTFPYNRTEAPIYRVAVSKWFRECACVSGRSSVSCRQGK